MNNVSHELKIRQTIELSIDLLNQIQDYTYNAISCCWYSDVSGLNHCIRTIALCAKALAENSGDLKAFEQEVKK